MKRASYLIIAVLIFVDTSSAQMKTSWQEKSSSLVKIGRAEQTVNRAIREFVQTLNFASVYKKEFIKDKSARRREDSPLLEGFIDGELLKNLDGATLKKAYIKSQNLYWLFMVYSMQQDSDDVSEIERGIVSKLNKRQRVFYERMMSEKESSRAKTRAELNDCLGVYEIMSAALRKKITPEFRKILRNKTAVTGELFDTSNAKSNLLKYETSFKITLKINGQLSPFGFTVVEKSGVMKILSVAICD